MDMQKVMNKKVFYILLATLIFMLVLFVVLLSRNKITQRLTPEVGTENTTPAQRQTKTQPLPKTNFSEYSLNVVFPTLPALFKTYTFKTSVTAEEVQNWAKTIGFKNVVIKEGANLIMATDQMENDQALLSVNKNNGSFLLINNTGFPVEIPDSDYGVAAKSFLDRLGIFDQSLVVSATYKRESAPGVTYVELHRDWNKLGLPLYNPVGILNLEEAVKLADVSLGYLENNAPADADIVSSSDNHPGKIRPNNFNTATVAIDETTNSVITVNSNLRLFERIEQKPAGQSLKTPEEALEELQKGQYSFSLVKPTGEGDINLGNVFPENMVGVRDAVINDFILTYVDDVTQKKQTALIPHYLFRGTASLESGYQVQFVQTVSALKDNNTLGLFAENAIPTVFTGQGNTIQYGTFNIPAPTPGSTAADCSLIDHIFKLPNGGYMAWYPNSEPRNWFYIPPPGETLTPEELDAIDDEMRALTTAACNLSKKDPSICAAPANFSASNCYFVGSASPFLHLYSKNTRDVKVRLNKNQIVYNDPPFTLPDGWDFRLDPASNLIFANGITGRGLYYEFNKEYFRPEFSKLRDDSRGFIVKKVDLKDFIDKLAEQLELNAAEKLSLSAELNKEKSNISAESLKIGIIDRQTLDKILPVQIYPQPETAERLIFYLTEGNPDNKINPPVLKPVDRNSDFSLVEIGAIGF